VRLLQKRHLVCVASLRERELDQALAADVDTLADALQAGAIARYLQQRSAAHEALRSHRVMVLDVTAEELPAALVERYLAVKRDGLLWRLQSPSPAGRGIGVRVAQQPRDVWLHEVSPVPSSAPSGTPRFAPRPRAARRAFRRVRA